ncbi:alpha/beta fold hydrolase [Pseudonocardia nantongensis]|uniref:alpha/beta fold hydrolase n=1 Tax=Pseudonocardia nantongensis TaxID=1181885 RepID=UPI003979A7ED
MVRWCGTALAALLCTVLLAGCSVGPSLRPPVAVRGEDLPAPPPPPAAAPADPDALPDTDPVRGGPTFTDCTAEVLAGLAASGTEPPEDRALAAGCGRLTVAADRARPDLGPARLGLTRITRPGAPEDLPALVVLGDTGIDGSSRAAATLAAQLPDEVLARYQVIGMDRRGSGTDLLDCAPPDARAALVDADPTSADTATMDRLLARSRAIVQDCYLMLSGTLTSFRAASTADDLEALRSALGTARLNVVGVGDGADAAAQWVTSHPEAAGRVVLDGPGDPTLDDPARTEAATASAEAAFDAFATACTAGPACPLGPDPRATVRGLLDRLSGTALPVGDGDTVTAGSTVHAVRTLLSQPARWPELTAALAAAVAGDPAGPARLLRSGGPGPPDGSPGSFDAALATRCNDSRVRTTPGEAADLAGQWGARFDLFGVAAAQQLVTCGPWPSGGTSASQSPGAPGAAPPPPVLVIGTARDPRSPQSGAERTAEQLGGGRLVRWQGAGTGAYPRTPCVTAVVDRALLEGRAPAEDVVCPP